jgi:hypothetical protein
MYDISTPTLVPIFDLIAQVATPHDLGTSPSGRRRVIPIIGGEVRGTKVQGRVLPGANDYQIIRSDNVLELEARYIIETTDSAQIFVINSGLRFGPADALARQARGELVDPALIYFRTIPRFETADPRYHWLMTRVFVCSGARFPDRVEIRFFELT